MFSKTTSDKRLKRLGTFVFKGIAALFMLAFNVVLALCSFVGAILRTKTDDEFADLFPSSDQDAYGISDESEILTPDQLDAKNSGEPDYIYR